MVVPGVYCAGTSYFSEISKKQKELVVDTWPPALSFLLRDGGIGDR